MFKMSNLVLYLFLLKSRVILDSALDYINKNSRNIKIFLKKNFKLYLEQRLYLTLFFILVLVETNPLIKKRNNKLNIV